MSKPTKKTAAPGGGAPRPTPAFGEFSPKHAEGQSIVGGYNLDFQQSPLTPAREGKHSGDDAS